MKVGDGRIAVTVSGKGLQGACGESRRGSGPSKRFSSANMELL